MRQTSLDWESGAAPQKRLGAEPQRNEIRSHRRSQEDGLCERDRPAQDQSDGTRPLGPGASSQAGAPSFAWRRARLTCPHGSTGP